MRPSIHRYGGNVAGGIEPSALEGARQLIANVALESLERGAQEFRTPGSILFMLGQSGHAGRAYHVQQERLLQGNPLLERSIRNRFPYLDPLNHVQVELLKEHRAQNPDEQVLRGIQITINGVSAGLRNSG